MVLSQSGQIVPETLSPKKKKITKTGLAFSLEEWLKG
jgi:hypothetical protein